LKQLESLVNSNLRTLIWVGHAFYSNNDGLTWKITGRQVMPTSSAYTLMIDNHKRLILPLSPSCNWLGGNATVHAMDWYGKNKFAALPPKVMTINNKPVGQVKNLDSFSWA
jgi:hypothetical protein